MRSHNTVTPVNDAPSAPPTDSVDAAEAALVEHYRRLVRLAYLVLPPSLGRGRRVLTAHAIVQRSLPRGRDRDSGRALPAPRRTDTTASPRAEHPGYGPLRVRVVRQALDANLPLLRFALPKRSQLPPLLPRVSGLRLFPRQGGAAELALDQRLAKMSAPTRAAFVLRGLERLPEDDVRRVLDAAGVADVGGAIARADRAGSDGDEAALLQSPEFDACSLQARPTDLMRRRQHGRAALAALAAAVVCGAVLGLPGDGWGPEGPAAPPYALNPASQAALDPAKVVRIAPTAWRTSARTDFSVWPARGALVKDADLLRRALAVWARPGGSVQVSTTPGTPSGPPMGPPQLLFAGTVDQARVVLFHDGLRIVRYAESTNGSAGAAIDFARVDGADGTSSDAVVVGRSDGNVRYLTAPWVSGTTVRDLLAPTSDARSLHLDRDGVSDPLSSPALATTCSSWDTLDVRADGGGHRLLTDLGELLPARLTSGSPSSPKDVTDAADRASWARTACLLPDMRAHGVRAVNSWQYARQSLPGGEGTADWVCTRGETWQGGGTRVLAQFRAPTTKDTNPGAVAASATDSPACGTKDPHVLAGVLWKSATGDWYLLAAGSEQVASVSTTGALRASAPGRFLAVPTKPGTSAGLKGRLTDGSTTEALH